MSVDALLEVAVGPRRVDAHPLFLAQQPFYDTLGPARRVRLAHRCHCKAPAIYGVHLDVYRAHPGRRQDTLHSTQRVVFQMLVADRVVGGQTQYLGHVTLFEMPYASGGQHVLNLARKIDRTF